MQNLPCDLLALYMNYLGVLNLLCECSSRVDEDTRERIECALRDAAQLIPGLQWQRVINRYDVLLPAPEGN